MIARDIPDEAEYISRAQTSDQFYAMMNRVEETVLGFEERQQSAVQLSDPETGMRGVRVDLVYDVQMDESFDDAALNIQVFYPDKGAQETVGYLRERDRLLTEFYTDTQVMPACRVEDWGGDVILEPRDYELDQLIP